MFFCHRPHPPKVSPAADGLFPGKIYPDGP
jgi:hypothetical protein